MNEEDGKKPNELELFDSQLITDYKKLNELQRGLRIELREKLYNGVKALLKNFTKDTATVLLMSRAVVQRLRRIGRLPPEVCDVLYNTAIADRQDLLVELSDQCEGKSIEVQVAYAKALVANPPKYGPRTTPKAKVPDAPDAELKGEGPAHAIVPFTFNGDTLEVVRLPDGDVGVVLRRLCDIVGVGLSSQLKRLLRMEAAGARWASMVMMTTQVGDQGRSTVIIPRRSIPMWAATLDASRCAPMARPKLVRYQDEAADVLASAFLPNNTPLAERIDAAIAMQIQVNAGHFLRIEKRLTALEHSGFGTRTMLLVPQTAPEESGYSMESMNKCLIEKGYNISPSDTAIRSIAAKMKLIGDTTYGFWNAHNDGVSRGSSLSESWRFNDTGTQALQEHAVVFCELKAKHEAAGEAAPRETALKETLDTVTAIGTGTYELLTRTRAPRRPPFPTIRGPKDNG